MTNKLASVAAFVVALLASAAPPAFSDEDAARVIGVARAIFDTHKAGVDFLECDVERLDGRKLKTAHKRLSPSDRKAADKWYTEGIGLFARNSGRGGNAGSCNVIVSQAAAAGLVRDVKPGYAMHRGDMLRLMGVLSAYNAATNGFPRRDDFQPCPDILRLWGEPGETEDGPNPVERWRENLPWGDMSIEATRDIDAFSNAELGLEEAMREGKDVCPEIRSTIA